MSAHAIEEMLEFIGSAPSPFHAVAAASGLLERSGFVEVDPGASWRSLPEACYITSSGALVAWRRPAGLDASTGLRIIGAHTDSPNLRLKPRPDATSAGWRQLGVEVYGGALTNSWLDRDLGLSGRVILADGSSRLVLLEQALARVAQLAIHLDRDVNERGLQLDKQLHLTPLWGLGTSREGDFVAWLADELGLARLDIAAFELMFHDLTPPSLLGVERELVSSARLDNLCSAWCATVALADSQPAEHTQIVCLFDHEEVGSASLTGAAGPMLPRVVDRLVANAGGAVDERARALSRSSCVSTDMAHAVHPNYPERHEPSHRPLPNQGPVVKVNTSQRYATDAVSSTIFTSACERADVPWQVFVSRNTQPCGSTIGPIVATELGIPTVDVGCAQLSMHSARELCGALDPLLMVRALRSYLA